MGLKRGFQEGIFKRGFSESVDFPTVGGGMNIWISHF